MGTEGKGGEASGPKGRRAGGEGKRRDPGRKAAAESGKKAKKPGKVRKAGKSVESGGSGKGSGRREVGAGPKRAKKKRVLGVVGWREWLALPELGIDRIKAKVDTGARSSSLHAYDIKRFERNGRAWVRFKVHPIQDDFRTTVETEAPLVEMRKVRSSSGAQTLRPVVRTEVGLGGERWQIELTLVRRDMMGFRMLLGRQAVRRRYLVDPGGSFLGGGRQA